MPLSADPSKAHCAYARPNIRLLWLPRLNSRLRHYLDFHAWLDCVQSNRSSTADRNRPVLARRESFVGVSFLNFVRFRPICPTEFLSGMTIRLRLRCIVFGPLFNLLPA